MAPGPSSALVCDDAAACCLLNTSDRKKFRSVTPCASVPVIGKGSYVPEGRYRIPTTNSVDNRMLIKDRRIKALYSSS